MRGYLKSFDDAKIISLAIKDEQLLLKYKEIWRTIQNILKRKKFDTEQVFNDQYLAKSLQFL